MTDHAEARGVNGAPELTDEALDSLIDAMGKMERPEGWEELTFEEQLEVKPDIWD